MLLLNKPLVWIGGCFLLGLYAGVQSHPLMVIFVCLMVICWSWFNRTRMNRINLALVLTIVFFSGYLYWQFWSSLCLPEIQPQLNGKALQGNAVIIAEPQHSQSQASLLVKVEHSNLKELAGSKLILKIKDLPVGALQYGQLIKFTGVFVIPATALNPGEFDYLRYLRLKGVAGLGVISKPAGVVVEAKGKGNWLQQIVYKIKHKLTGVIGSALQPDQATVLQGIILGDRAEIDSNVLANFRYLGIIHILSVSGFQVGLILLGLKKLVKTTGLSQTMGFWVILAGVVCYMLITGLAAPVLRAGLMAIVALIGQHQLRSKDWLSALAFAALVLAVRQPTAILEAGFQLSFTATWAILYLSPVISTLMDKVWAGKWLKGIVSIPLAAQIGTLPIIAWHFNSISLLAMFGNVFLVWLVIPATLLGMLGAIIGSVSFLPGWLLLKAAGLCTKLLVIGSNYLAQLPGGNIHVSSPSRLQILFWYGVLLVVVQLYQHPGVRIFVRGWVWRKEALVISLALVLVGGSALVSVAQPRELAVTFLAVGQGDAVVIQTPNGKVWLVDVGGSSPGGERRDPGLQVVVPYLSKLGVNQIAGIILTHPDSDHINGLSAVLDNFQVHQVVVSPWFSVEPLGQTQLKLIGQKRVLVQAVSQGQKLLLAKGVFMEVLNPLTGESGQTYTNSNNSSLVLKLINGKRSFLLTGDAEVEILDQLANGEQLRTDVVKIPHHGSRSALSSAAYQSMGAHYAIVSVGKNSFGHPHQEVMEYLKDNLSQVWRTDQAGAITIKTDGSQMWLTSLRGDRVSGL